MQYENGSFKEEVGDAPWAARGGSIPLAFFIKDANEWPLSFDYLRLYEIIGASRVLLVADEADKYIASDLIAWRVDLPAGSVGVTREFDWELRFSDPLPHTNHYANRVLIGQPLPSLTGWKRFDLHLHTFGTDTFFEWGAPTEFMAASASAIGLDGVGITDHGESLTDQRWATLLAEAAALSNGTRLVLPGIEATVDNNATNEFPDQVLHLTCHGLTRVLRTPAEYPSANQSGQLWTLPRLLDSLVSQDAVCFAAHPEDQIEVAGYGTIVQWSSANYTTALASPAFLGLQFFNQRKTVYDDPTPTEDYVNPFVSWQTNPDWPRQYDAGMRRYQQLVQGLLAAVSGDVMLVRTLWFEAGADAHGDANYKRTNRYGSFDLAVNDDAIGKIATLLFLPGGLTGADAIAAMRAGRMIVSDGPLLCPRVRLPGGAMLEIGSRLADPTGSNLVLEGGSIGEFGPFSSVFVIRMTAASVDTLLLPVSGMTVAVEFPLESFCDSSQGAFLVVEAHTVLGYRSVANPLLVGPATATDTASLARLNWLGQNEPNPFRGETSVRFSLALPGQAKLEIFDVRGRLVKTLVADSRERTAASRSLDWDGSDSNGSALPAGVYVYRLRTASFLASRKMVLLR